MGGEILVRCRRCLDLFVSHVEGDLHPASSPRLGRMGDCVDIAGQGVGGRQHLVEGHLAGEFERELETARAAAVVGGLGSVGVGADEFGLSMPEGGEIEFDHARHAEQHHPAPRATHPDRCFDRLLGADGIDDDVGATGESAVDHERAGRSSDCPAEFVGCAHDVGAELLGELPLDWVLGPDQDRAGEVR